MPKVYADLHDDFMNIYMQTSRNKVMNRERMVLCMNSQGYLLPCSLMIKVLPNLSQGISIVGFLSDEADSSAGGIITMDQAAKTHYMIYNPVTFVIQGVTYSVFTNMGIPAALVSGQMITGKNLYKNTFSLWNC